MKSLAKLWLAFLIAAVTVVLVAEVQGQGTQSTILGTVTDPTGAVVTGATVTVKNEGTNFERTMVTDETRRLSYRRT